MRLTHWKKLSNPNYLGAYSIEDNKDLILTISKVQQETVTGPDGKKDECIVCYFSESEKPMILNSTNAKQIQKLLNTPYIEKWIGHKIQIGIEKVRAFGEALSIRCPVEQDYFDERLTSAQANRVLISADVSRKKRKNVVDMLAAQLILQAYIDARS